MLCAKFNGYLDNYTVHFYIFLFFIIIITVLLKVQLLKSDVSYYPAIFATLRTIGAVNRQLGERVARYIMFHYLTFTFSQKRVGTHKARTHTVSRNLKLKVVFYMHIKPTVISLFRLYLSSANYPRILFTRSGWTLVLFWLWSAYTHCPGTYPSTAVVNQRQKTRQRSDEENASLTRQQDVINDPHEGHLESANPIREFREEKKKDHNLRFHRARFSLNMPKEILFRHSLIVSIIGLN